MKEMAVDHFKSRRGNCAQAVALAWKEKRNAQSVQAEQFASHGGGRAPQGFCGALHAARELAGAKKDTVTEQFKLQAEGHTACRDIRRNRIMPCTACVEAAAGILEKTIP
ncbi:MAG TPA: C-GCAxxG-C-C family (seleno)protein [Tichowtungia sp.]|nr:C-GCAxxG-C-C family (seleno)protein [Tichowtungia sp.]